MKKMRYVGLYENTGLINGCIYDVSDFEPWNQMSTVHCNGVTYNVARSSLVPVEVVQKIDNTIATIKDNSKLLQKKQQWIDEIMDDFDFHSVATAMKALEWEWQDAFEGVPTESEIRKQTRHMLKAIDVVKTATSTGYYNTGGFIASGDYDADNNLEGLLLVFQLFECRAYD